MLILIVPVTLTVIFATACIIFRSKNKSFEGMICKFLASFGFISTAVAGNALNHSANLQYFSLAAVALLFGVYGDIFLGIKEIAPTFRKKLLPIGTAFFLIGHIVYLFAFNGLVSLIWPTVLAFPVGVLIAFIIIKVGKFEFGVPFTVILCAYYGLLVWKIAASAFLLYKAPCTANTLVLIASLLFFVSDNCLALLYFLPTKSKNALVTIELSTYYPAQLLLALSVALR